MRVEPPSLPLDPRIEIACQKGAEVGEDEVAGSVASLIAGFVLTLDDGEGGKNLSRFVTRQAVQVTVGMKEK